MRRLRDYDAQFNLTILFRSGQGRPRNFVQALIWSILAQLGGLGRAIKFRADLSELVTPDHRPLYSSDISQRLCDWLARGDRIAIIQYIDFISTTLPETGMPGAYVWSLVAVGIGVDNAAAKRDEIMAELDTEVILASQDEARALCDESDMTTLFADQASAGL